jgi:transcriptional regulator with XRE-family HTH domain
MAEPEKVETGSKKAIGERLKQARRTSGRQIAWYAEQLGWGVPAIYAWEKGRNQPDLITLGAYAGLLGVSVSWVISGEDEATVALLRWARLVAEGVTGDHAAKEAASQAGLSPADLALVRRAAPGMLATIRERLGDGWEERPDRELLPVLQALVAELERE